MAGGKVFHVPYEIILREFLGHNFVSNLRTLKPLKTFKLIYLPVSGGPASGDDDLHYRTSRDIETTRTD